MKGIGILAVDWCDRDADTGAYDDLLAVDLVGLANNPNDAAREIAGGLRLLDRPLLDDGKLVAAKARGDVVLADA